MTLLAEAKPVRFSQRLIRLLDQQFWRWGCDVKHDTGNLLVRFGFQRIPPPHPDSTNSSVYVLELDPHTRVVLRGSAAFYGKDQLGGLVMKRFDSQPYRTPAAHLEDLPHTPDCLPPLDRFTTSDQGWPKLASELFRWIAQYEAWIVHEYGTQYVEHTLALRDKRPVVEVAAAEAEWLRFADELE